MSDLVKRLRELETKLPASSDNWIEARELQMEAAARIEALEAGLKPFVDHDMVKTFEELSLRDDLGWDYRCKISDLRHAASLLEPKT